MSPKSWTVGYGPSVLPRLVSFFTCRVQDDPWPLPRTPIFSMTHQADSTPAARCLGGAGVCSRWALECGMRPDGYPRLEPVHSIASSKSPTWLYFPQTRP